MESDSEEQQPREAKQGKFHMRANKIARMPMEIIRNPYRELNFKEIFGKKFKIIKPFLEYLGFIGDGNFIHPDLRETTTHDERFDILYDYLLNGPKAQEANIERIHEIANSYYVIGGGIDLPATEKLRANPHKAAALLAIAYVQGQKVAEQRLPYIMDLGDLYYNRYKNNPAKNHQELEWANECFREAYKTAKAFQQLEDLGEKLTELIIDTYKDLFKLSSSYKPKAESWCIALGIEPSAVPDSLGEFYQSLHRFAINIAGRRILLFEIVQTFLNKQVKEIEDEQSLETAYRNCVSELFGFFKSDFEKEIGILFIKVWFDPLNIKLITDMMDKIFRDELDKGHHTYAENINDVLTILSELIEYYYEVEEVDPYNIAYTAALKHLIRQYEPSEEDTLYGRRIIELFAYGTGDTARNIHTEKILNSQDRCVQVIGSAFRNNGAKLVERNRNQFSVIINAVRNFIFFQYDISYYAANALLQQFIKYNVNNNELAQAYYYLGILHIMGGFGLHRDPSLALNYFEASIEYYKQYGADAFMDQDYKMIEALMQVMKELYSSEMQQYNQSSMNSPHFLLRAIDLAVGGIKSSELGQRTANNFRLNRQYEPEIAQMTATIQKAMHQGFRQLWIRTRQSLMNHPEFLNTMAEMFPKEDDFGQLFENIQSEDDHVPTFLERKRLMEELKYYTKLSQTELITAPGEVYLNKQLADLQCKYDENVEDDVYSADDLESLLAAAKKHETAEEASFKLTLPILIAEAKEVLYGALQGQMDYLNRLLDDADEIFQQTDEAMVLLTNQKKDVRALRFKVLETMHQFDESILNMSQDGSTVSLQSWYFSALENCMYEAMLLFRRQHMEQYGLLTLFDEREKDSIIQNYAPKIEEKLGELKGAAPAPRAHPMHAINESSLLIVEDEEDPAGPSVAQLTPAKAKEFFDFCIELYGASLKTAFQTSIDTYYRGAENLRQDNTQDARVQLYSLVFTQMMQNEDKKKYKGHATALTFQQAQAYKHANIILVLKSTEKRHLGRNHHKGWSKAIAIGGGFIGGVVGAGLGFAAASVSLFSPQPSTQNASLVNNQCVDFFGPNTSVCDYTYELVNITNTQSHHIVTNVDNIFQAAIGVTVASAILGWHFASDKAKKFFALPFAQCIAVPDKFHFKAGNLLAVEIQGHVFVVHPRNKPPKQSMLNGFGLFGRKEVPDYFYEYYEAGNEEYPEVREELATMTMGLMNDGESIKRKASSSNPQQLLEAMGIFSNQASLRAELLEDEGNGLLGAAKDVSEALKGLLRTKK